MNKDYTIDFPRIRKEYFYGTTTKRILYRRRLLEKIIHLEAEHSNNVKAAQSQLNAINTTIATNNSLINKIQEELSSLSSKDEKIQKQIQTQTRKLQRVKELYKSVDYCITNFLDNDISQRLSLIDESEYDEFAPSVTLKLHCMDIKSLRKAYKENDKAIDKILSSYAKR